MMPVSPKRCPYLSKDVSVSKSMPEPDYINLNSIELKRCSTVQLWLPLKMVLTKEGVQLKHPMRWHKVMSLMHCLVFDECIHIYFP